MFVLPKGTRNSFDSRAFQAAEKTAGGELEVLKSENTLRHTGTQTHNSGKKMRIAVAKKGAKSVVDGARNGEKLYSHKY